MRWVMNLQEGVITNGKNGSSGGSFMENSEKDMVIPKYKYIVYVPVSPV